MSTLVAFQGEAGAFSDAAARDLIPGTNTRGYQTFEMVADAAINGEAEFALLPVENSIAGPIARTYDLLWERPALRIIDETVHRVELHLIGVPGAQPKGIREVRSHPVALDQVRDFLRTQPEWSVRAVDDTAGAVAEIVSRGDPTVAAIGPELAAERYGGTILRRSIQDTRENFTRFFLVARNAAPRRALGYACVGFELADRPGALRDALSAFADRGLNLRALVSRPDRKTPFRYRFYCEIGAPDGAALDGSALDDALAALGEGARALGVY